MVAVVTKDLTNLPTIALVLRNPFGFRFRNPLAQRDLTAHKDSQNQADPYRRRPVAFESASGWPLNSDRCLQVAALNTYRWVGSIPTTYPKRYGLKSHQPTDQIHAAYLLGGCGT